MKTLKTFFVLLAIIVTSSTYSQTKEETMEWLERNGKDFLSSEISVMSPTEFLQDY